MRCAHMRQIGRALDTVLLDAGVLGGAVAPLCAFRNVAVNLDHLRIVHVGTKGFLDRVQPEYALAELPPGRWGKRLPRQLDFR
jgi:hypothetical protein